MHMKRWRNKNGFTIVELAVVVTVIAILATVVVVGYNGITRNAVVNSMKSDLHNAASSIEAYRMKHKSIGYPESLGDVDVATSEGNSFIYMRTIDSYCVSVSNERDDISPYHISSEQTSPAEGLCPGYVPPDDEEPIAQTPEACFAMNAGVILNYFDHEDNDSLNPACSRDVNIPSAIGGVAITQIGGSAFAGKQLTSLILPDTITLIATDAFSSNQLTTLVIPNSVTSISTDAFYNNQLTSVTFELLPCNLYISNHAFDSNQLTSVTLRNATVETYAFDNTVTINNIAVPC